MSLRYTRGGSERRRPDIVTLQKIGPKKNLPTTALRKIGYESECLVDIPCSWLGVAILSRCSLPTPEVLVRDLPGVDQPESRFLTVKIGELWVSSVYAPYGPLRYRPEDSKPKHAQAVEQRVAWLHRLRDHIHYRGYADRDSLLCGDFNVKVRADGPFRWHDPYYSEEDRDAFEELLSVGFADLYRQEYPNWKDKPGFTHRYTDQFPDGTSRLHLVLASKSLTERLQSICVDLESRPWPRKDSPPVVAELQSTNV